MSNENNEDHQNVRYGVKLSEDGELLEFVELLENENYNCETTKSEMTEHILSMNETLAEMQSSLWKGRQNNSTSGSNNCGLAMKCIYDGPYVAQLQIVRTLRPPRSKEMSGATAASTTTTATVSCQPPKYDPSNSFLVGPLRLFGHGDFHGDGEPRVRMAKLSARPNEDNENDNEDAHERLWDIYHNISPVDPRGHFLLLPDLDRSKENWRDQSLIATDCHDMTYLASTMQPVGSLMITFNSVGAGASQNHIHCHGWVCPPPPLLQGRGSGYYAVEDATALSTLIMPEGTTVSLLDHPCTCIKLSVTADMAEQAGKQRRPTSTLDELGKTIATIVQIAQEIDSPYNVAWTSRNEKSSERSVLRLTSYIFVRSKAETTIPNTHDIFRLGASEMMGLFHCSSNAQMESLSPEGCMESILRDVSKEPRGMVWDRVVLELKKNRNVL